MAGFSILMLPLDVANGSSGGFPMAQLWLAVYIVIAALVVVIIPFTIFYYESEEADDTGEAPSQLAGAIKGTLITVIVFIAITVILWYTIGIAEIPVVKFSSVPLTVEPPTLPEITTNLSGPVVLNDTLLAEIQPTECFNVSIETNTTLDNETIFTNSTNFTEICYYPFTDLRPEFNRTNNQSLKFRVTFLLYIISMVVFFGWLLLIIFGGIGLVALPWDCINDFKKRPIPIAHDVFAKKKKEIGERATKLIEIGVALRDKQRKGEGSSRRARRKMRTNYNKFRQAVYFLEEDYEQLQICYKRQGGKIILYYAMLIFGFIAVCLTILWILQILLYLLTQPYPFNPFLNTMLRAMDGVFPFFGTIFYGLFAFYLLFCCIKGNFKFGLRFFFLFPIHPMKVGGTLMNSFLFNVLLILICAVAVTQFTSQAFSAYAGLTDINSMFSLAVRYLMGLKYIFLGYNYALFCMIFLALIYFIVKPKDRPAVDQISI